MNYIFRGFHECEDGTQIVVINGKEYKGNWIDGYFFKIWHEYYILWGTTNGIPNMFEVIPETVCEWTGLTDKNGNKIWENDKVKFTDEYRRERECYVTYSERCACYCLEGDKLLEQSFFTLRNKTAFMIEVIGTIFDNEEK